MYIRTQYGCSSCPVPEYRGSRACHSPSNHINPLGKRVRMYARTTYVFGKTPGQKLSISLYQFSYLARLVSRKTMNFANFEKKIKLRTAVYPSNMAPFHLKLWGNTFQTIPDILLVDSRARTHVVFFFQIVSDFEGF